jgi:hypothetical protein
MKKIVIYQDVSEDGLFSGDFTGVDFDSSRSKFIYLLSKVLHKRFPKCEIQINQVYYSTMKSVLIYGFSEKEYNYTLSLIEVIIQEIYSDFKWIVMK